MPDTNTLGIVTTCKESPKQMREFVNYHLNFGASHIILYFDDPTDPAMEQFRDHAEVDCRSCDAQHWESLLGRPPGSIGEAQVANLEEGTSLLKSKGVAWVASIDADELLYSPTPIAHALAALDPDIDVVQVSPAEAVQHNGMRHVSDFQSRYFRQSVRAPTPEQDRVIMRYAPRVDEFGERGCLAHVKGKPLFRTSATITRFQIHDVVNRRNPLRKGAIDGLVLLHFDAMNFESWERKWMRRLSGKTLIVKASERRRRQHEYIHQAWQTGGREGLKLAFNELHYYEPGAIEALRAAGLLRKIEIPDTYFSGPVSDASTLPAPVQ